MEDRELLEKYVATGSDDAFTELVSRHLGLVYSTALRRVGESHTAEEVTQTVFTLLARQARCLGPNVILAGWLYKTACFKAAQQKRAEFRRLKRDMEASAMQQELNSSSETEACWRRIEPLLDDAMEHLGEKDRAAILLRFFERKRIRDVGLVLGMEEEAARKRVDRALTKLRQWFAARGVAYSSTSLAVVLTTHATQAASNLVPASVTAAALQAAAGLTGATSLAPIIPILTIMKLKTVLITTSLLLLAALVIVQRQNKPSAPSLPLPETSSSVSVRSEPSIVWRRFHAVRQSRQADIVADDSLRVALARLREALYGPPVQGTPAEDPAREILKSIPIEQRGAAFEMVADALRDSNKHVCLRAIGLVPYIWPDGQAAVPILFDLIRTKSNEWPEVASNSMIAASQVQSQPEIVPELVAAAMQGGDNARRGLAVQLPLLKSFIPESADTFASNLLPYLYSFAPDERFTAAQALAQLPGPKDPAVVSELVAGFTAHRDGSPASTEDIRASLGGLRAMGPDAAAAIPDLLSFAEQNAGWADAVNFVLKAVAPEDMKGVGIPTPLPPLDPVAATIADRIEDGTMTVAGLASALENPRTALVAARALAEFGPAAAEALPALEQVFQSALQTNLSVAVVLGAAIERLNPELPKPLLLPFEVMPALEAVHAEAQRASRPDWNRALELLPQRAPIGGMGFRHEDIRRIADELSRIDPALRKVFVGKLLDADRKFAAIIHAP